MAFDPDAYLASKAPQSAPQAARSPGQSLTDLPKDSGAVSEFNPDAYLQLKAGVQPEEQASQTGGILDRAQTQLESFGNTVTMGYLPQIQALHEKLMGDPNAEVDAQLKSQGFKLEQPESSYVNMRDENIKRQEAQAKRNPYDSAAGMISGMAVTAPIMTGANAILNGGKAAVGGIARLRDAGRVGATYGMVANPGDEQGVVSPLQATERLQNAATGGAIGVAGQGAGEGISKVNEIVRKAPEALEKISKSAAFKATGAMLKDFRAAFGRNSTEEIGETLLSKGIVKAGDTLDDIAQKTEAAKQETGSFIGEIHKKVEDIVSQAKASGKLSRADTLRLKASELDGQKIANTAAGLIKKNGQGKLGGSKIISSVQDKLDDLASRKDLTLKDLVEFKSGIDADINYSKQMKELPEVQQQLKGLRDYLNKKIEDRVRVAGKIVRDDALIGSLKKAKKEYGHLATANRTASDRINRTDANNFFSLGDKMIGSAVGAGEIVNADSPEAAVKAALKGVVAASISKTGRTYGPAALASASQRFSKLMQQPANFAKFGKPLMEAAKRSPEEFQALLNQLGSNPEFKKLVTPQGAR